MQKSKTIELVDPWWDEGRNTITGFVMVSRMELDFRKKQANKKPRPKKHTKPIP